MPNMEYESDKWHLWNVHVAPASRTAGCLFPCMLDLDRDVHFNYGGIGLLDGRWQHCIATVNISLYTWVYKYHIHECIWQNKGEWSKWAEVWLYTECYMEIYQWIDIVGNLAKNITNIYYTMGICGTWRYVHLRMFTRPKDEWYMNIRRCTYHMSHIYPLYTCICFVIF